MKIALHGRNFKPEVQPYIAQMLTELQQRGVEMLVSKTFAEFLHPLELFPSNCTLYHGQEDLGKPDFFLSFGGDGTLLEAVTHVGENQTPIVGINTGRLGFLANAGADSQSEPGVGLHLHGAARVCDRRSHARLRRRGHRLRRGR